MKTAVYCSVFTLVSLWTFSAFGQGTCQNNGGGSPTNGGQPGYPSGPVDHYSPGIADSYVPDLPPITNPYVAQPAAATVPTRPTARITVVSVNPSATSQLASTVPSARLTVVADEAPAAPKTIEIAVDEPVIDAKIAGLVGTWKAVARHGDGELTTVELHLDNRGWAELTVPGKDGQPSTTKSRINLENQELKLTGSDKVVSLGKLVDFNTRQLVLERAEGQMTFVRI